LLAALANPEDAVAEPVTPPKRRRAAAGD
jgi:hypothetical protein